MYKNLYIFYILHTHTYITQKHKIYILRATIQFYFPDLITNGPVLPLLLCKKLLAHERLWDEIENPGIVHGFCTSKGSKIMNRYCYWYEDLTNF